MNKITDFNRLVKIKHDLLDDSMLESDRTIEVDKIKHIPSQLFWVETRFPRNGDHYELPSNNVIYTALVYTQKEVDSAVKHLSEMKGLFCGLHIRPTEDEIVVPQNDNIKFVVLGGHEELLTYPAWLDKIEAQLKVPVYFSDYGKWVHNSIVSPSFIAELRTDSSVTLGYNNKTEFSLDGRRVLKYDDQDLFYMNKKEGAELNATLLKMCQTPEVVIAMLDGDDSPYSRAAKYAFFSGRAGVYLTLAVQWYISEGNSITETTYSTLKLHLRKYIV